MKKWLFSCVFLLILFAIPSVLAEDLQVSDYNIDVSVQKNGDLVVSEEMTFQANRQYNGVYYQLDKQETKGKYTQVTDVSAAEKTAQGEQTLSQSDSQQEQTYQLSDTGSYLKFKLFLPLNNNSRTVLLRYTLKQSVINYLDAAEINRKFVGQGWEIDQKNIRIHIRFPEALSAEHLKAWGHASDEGQVTIDPDYKGVTFTSPHNQAGDFIEARVLFSPDLTADNPNQVSTQAWDRITSEEGKRAYETLRHQKEIEEEKKQARILSIGLFPVLGAILLGVYPFVHKPYKRWEEKIPLVPEHLFEIPRDLSPAVVNVAIFHRLDGADLGATLLDLVRKKKVALEALSKDYGFTLLSKEGLLAHEDVLVSFLFDTISSDNSWLTLNQIKRYAKKHPNKYVNHLQQFKTAASNQAPSYSDKNTRFSTSYTWISSVIAILALFISIWTLDLSADFIPYTIGISVLVCGILLSNRLFHHLFLKRRSQKEEYEYRQWKAFRKMLIDISRLDQADIESVIIWDHILVYAVSLGVAKEVIQRLKQVFPEGLPTTNFNADYQSFIYNTAFLNQFNHSFQQSYQAATSINTSGSGGGFSGGSSGGFGGGSGGGGF
ncbi:DUF2207 domain-containing protein [Streptococcus himalayensis]|uniref:DUF2207 domain-containing protein n=1 Tax=Streptococcus himalayensis TaxID=1888195 RepID=A0A917A8H0_9STRE|nr:DUF2207 domain-containing protein [Streptococcus himalayensis]GGE35002.1 hypothetical protein GCM10011510_15450 [Streptococcus himalayensis]